MFTCSHCDNDNIIHVSSGVNANGEWHTLECVDCGRVWVVEQTESGRTVVTEYSKPQ